jgi:alpha-glucoside transport system substrate-binding protein
MSRWRRAASLAMCLAAVGSLAACDDSSSSRAVTVVDVFGSLSDADVDAFEASVAPFERRTGIDVRYVGSADFEADLSERLRRGDPPALALLPQPGLLRALVDEGFALPWTGDLADAATGDVDPRLVDLVTVGDQQYGAWYSLNTKSLVWYSPAALSARGVEVPTTWDELTAITDAAIADGVSPWCLGIRDGPVTGWVATDWVEDMVLRFEGTDVYDDWVAHRIPFDDPAIVDAVSRFGAIALDQRSVYRGNRAAVELSITDAARALLSSPSTCLFHRQGSVLPRLLDSSVTYAPDGDLWAFPLPAVDGGGAPLVVGGTVLVRFDERPEAAELARYLTTAEAAVPRAARGGFVSPLESFPLDSYALPIDAEVARLLRDADVLRFDASDLMPAEVGTGTFWAGMTAYLGGARLTSVLADIDRSWPITPKLPVISPPEATDG